VTGVLDGEPMFPPPTRPPQPGPHPRPTDAHTYTLPHVIEQPRPVGPATFDPSIW
jgi:hypothetical protein